MPTRRVPDEPPDLDEELDLPPADADGDDDRAGLDDDELPDLTGEEGLDDAEADDLDVGGDDLEITDEEDAAGGEDDVDVGALDEDILVDEAAASGDEPEGAPEDDGIIADDAAGDDDGGAEGTSEDPGDEVDEGALPDLDDDDGDPGEGALAETLLAESDGGLPWAGARWARLEGAGAEVPCRAVAAAAGRVAAAGEVLLLIEEGALAPRRLGFAEGSVAVAVADDAILAATARGQLFLAGNDGAGASAIGSWRAGVSPSLGLWPADGGGVEIAATPGRFWIRAGAALLGATSPDQPLAAVRERGVIAVAASAGALTALTLGAEGPVIERFLGDDTGWAATPLTGDARRLVDPRLTVRLAAAGAHAVALASASRVAISRDGGASFTTIDLGPVAALAFAGDDDGAPLLALLAPGPTASLVTIDAAGEAARAGEIPAPDRAAASPWSECALAWDAARDVAWIACAAGLFAFGRPRRH